MAGLDAVCVFCGAGEGDAGYLDAARRFGAMVADRGARVVYGGSSLGVMRAVADGALDAGGDVVGVMPRHLMDRDVPYGRVTEMVLTDTMHERKAAMYELADAFVALPGGLGTLDELVEILTWAQLGLHAKPVGALNVRGYFDGLLAFLGHAAAEGFLHPDVDGHLVVAREPTALLDGLRARRTG